MHTSEGVHVAEGLDALLKPVGSRGGRRGWAREGLGPSPPWGTHPTSCPCPWSFLPPSSPPRSTPQGSASALRSRWGSGRGWAERGGGFGESDQGGDTHLSLSLGVSVGSPGAGGQGCQGNWATHPPEEAEHREGLCMRPWVPLGVGEDQGPRSGLAGGRRRAVGLFIIMGARSELPPLE